MEENNNKNNATETVNKTVDDIKDNLTDLNNTADTTGEYSAEDINNNKMMAVICYVWVLVFVPMFTEAKNSPFVKFHMNQGLINLIAAAALNIVAAVLGGIPVIGFIIRLAAWIITVALAAIGIMNANSGKAKELPIVGGIKIIK